MDVKPVPEIYTREYYQRLFELEDRHWWYIGMREIAAALLSSQPGRRPYLRVLDAGCGTGSSMAWAKHFLGSRIVVGTDIAKEALELCRSRPGLHVVQASVLQLPFRSGSFDLIICQDVLQHLPTDGSDVHVLTEMHRVLRPGGLLLVRANSRLGMWQEATAQDAGFQRYTLPEIVSGIRAAGFIAKRATYANALPAFYASLKRWVQFRFRRNHHLYEGLRIQDTASQHFWLNQFLLLVLKVEAFYLSAPHRRLVFGHSTFCLGLKPPDEATAPSGEVDKVTP
ncbi:MAG TPA: class I SAM-dependent methyltransferase [Candidatus Hypogeohydataceae bacterium YC41]